MATAALDDDDFYPMNASPKGICLIINNFEFDCSPHLETGQADGDNLTSTFKNLDFEIRYFENLTAEEMTYQMECIRKEDHSKYDCFVCCISSHGNRNGVCGSDDATVKVEQLQSLLFSRECKSLAGKPKLFFVDTCQGHQRQKGMSQPRSSAPTHFQIADKVDFLMAFATTTSNVSYGSDDPSKGSRYFCQLTTLMELFARSKHVTWLLQKVTNNLQKESTEKNVQTSVFHSTLTKDFYFFPPIEGEESPAAAKPAASADKDSSRNHVMISYIWKDQTEVLWIRDTLKKHNYKVWIDVDNMWGDLLTAMADAVENAAVVLVCFSENYNKSTNCKKECTYATACGKPLIPLRMDSCTPTGWLGFIVGSTYIDFSKVRSNPDVLLKALGEKGKN